MCVMGFASETQANDYAWSNQCRKHSAVGRISTPQPTICMEYLVHLAPDSGILLQVCSPWGLVLLQATGCMPNEHMTSRKTGGWLVLLTSLSALTGGELLHAGFITWCANAWQLVGWHAGALRPGDLSAIIKHTLT